MPPHISASDTRMDYIKLADAKKLSGLRLILGAYPIPGPWREACKGLFYVKGIPYTPVATSNDGISDVLLGMNDSQSQLISWTGQSSAPVALWNNELPRSKWIDQIALAESLSPEPRLVPEDIELRIRMFGLINELASENGLLWLKRLGMAHGPLQNLSKGDEARALWAFFGQKYGYKSEAAETASKRMVQILDTFHQQLVDQKAQGSQYLIGHELSAVDIFWSTSCGFFDPLPDDLCPMWSDLRTPWAYGCDDPLVQAALTSELRSHRDFIYEKYLELPIVF